MNKPLLTCAGLALALASWMSSAGAVQGDTRALELKAADLRLNQAYRRVLASMTPADQKLLKEAQRQWIRYRDLDCRWAFRSEPEDCLISRTEARAVELEDSFFNAADGSYTSVGASKPVPAR